MWGVEGGCEIRAPFGTRAFASLPLCNLEKQKIMLGMIAMGMEPGIEGPVKL